MNNGRCSICGYPVELHHCDTDQCPEGGEAPIGRKQRWASTTFTATIAVPAMINEVCAVCGKHPWITCHTKSSNKWEHDYVSGVLVPASFLDEVRALVDELAYEKPWKMTTQMKYLTVRDSLAKLEAGK